MKMYFHPRILALETPYLYFLLFAVNQEGVLQKFRKTFSLRFYKKSSKESGSSDLGETLSEILAEPNEEDPLDDVPSASASSTQLDNAKEDDSTEQKPR